MNRIFAIIIPLVLLIGLGCSQRPTFFVEEGDLSFDVDTVYFDSIFVNFDSPTERLVVTNNSGKNIRISRIEFENGSDFGLIFDGLTANVIEDYELADGDSAVAFISFNSEVRDEFLRDKILFTVGDQTQDVDIEAYVFDGILLSDSLLTPPVGNSVVWDPSFKYIVDGPLVVPDGVTLIIPAGTEVYFTSRKDEQFNLTSSIIVYGTLRVFGEEGSEVLFQQTRFGDRYDETPGQWRGIAFASISRGNIIRHAVIKNGLIGVYQEYANNGVFAKVLLENTEIRNMAAYGIYGAGLTLQLDNYPLIQADNCLIHNNSEGNLRIVGGGYYEFNYCTFVSYSINFSRNTPMLNIGNYGIDGQDAVEVPTKVNFTNCIVWGSEDEEYVQDTLPGSTFEITFDYSMVRTTLPLHGSNNITGTDPVFPQFVKASAAEPYERDYRLEATSPAVDAGTTIPGLSSDMDGLPRDAQPDIGAYEYRE